MQRYSPFLRVAFALVLGGPTGCALESDSPEYTMGFHNETTTRIADARVDWHERGVAHYDGGGELVPDQDKVSHQDPRPIPRNATVTWKTADGKAHSQEVEIARLIADPTKFSGTIYFKFLKDNRVSVVPMTYKEIEQMADQGRSVIPPDPPAASQSTTRPSK